MFIINLKNLFKSLLETLRFLAITVTFSVLLYFIPFILNNGEVIEPDFYGNPALMMVSQGALLIAVLLALLFSNQTFHKDDPIAVGFNPSVSGILHGLVLGAIPISLGVFSLVGLDFIVLSYWGIEPRFTYLVTGFALVAVVEEILFRGVVLNLFLSRLTVPLAIISSSAIFAALHLWNDGTSAIGILNIGLSGVLMGILYIRKMNIWAPIGMHFTWNFVQGPVFGFAVSGHPTNSLFIMERSGSDHFTGGAFGLEGSVILTAILVMAIAMYWWTTFGLAKSST